MALEARQPGATLFRIGRKPDPWAAPDWAYALDDGTFGNRFDDPEGCYRALYASTQRRSCFTETLARFRPSLEVLAGLNEIDGPDDFLLFRVNDWVANRRMGSALAKGVFADIYADGWVSLLRQELAAKALALGIRDVDTAALQASEPRGLTQAASLKVRLRGFDGIYYCSRFGHSLENWALFEPWNVSAQTVLEIAVDDPELCAVLKDFAIATSDAQ